MKGTIQAERRMQEYRITNDNSYCVSRIAITSLGWEGVKRIRETPVRAKEKDRTWNVGVNMETSLAESGFCVDKAGFESKLVLEKNNSLYKRKGEENGCETSYCSLCGN